MHITTECPRCHTRYQLDPSLRGQKMRCPNPRCRQVFDVTDVDTPFNRGDAALASGTTNQGGSVSDLVPLLPAEAVGPAPADAGSRVGDFVPLVPAEAAEPPAPDAAPPWSEPPPVRGKTPSQPAAFFETPPRRPANDPAPATQEADWRSAFPGATPAAKTPEPPARKRDKKAGPVELPPGAWEPPPVRRSREDRAAATGDDRQEGPLAGEIDSEAEAARKAKSRRARRLMAVIVLGVLVVLGGAGGIAWYFISQGEEKQYATALKDYDEARFSAAADRFRKLGDKFPESGRLNEFRFMASLADLRGAAADPQLDTAKALALVGEFVNENDKPETRTLLEERSRDLGQSLVKRADTFLDQNAATADPNLGTTFDQLEQAVRRLRKRFPRAVEDSEDARIAEKLKGQRDRLARALKIKEQKDALRQLGRDPTIENVRLARARVKEQSRRFPELATDPEVADILRAISDGQRQRIRYEAAPRNGAALPPLAGRGADTAPGILIEHLVRGRPRPAAEDKTVLALARGVLYALSAATGETLWAMRVGIDTVHLPVRLPPTAAHPNERLLVLSADTRTLTALDLGGNPIWHYPLSAAALGRPVLINRRGALVAYLPTYDGTVHEIGLAEGRLLGRFHLGQPLAAGGVHQKGTDLVYFPADDTCVYVLNVATKKCVAVLYTNHPSGSLRGEPLILGGDDERAGKTPAYLLLTLASGLDETALRLYELPARDGDVQPAMGKNEPRIRGWTWSTPYHDGEKVVCLSDAGRLGLFGIRQVGNQDRPLFPLVPSAEEGRAGLDLTELLGNPTDRRRGRSLVAHVQGDEFWVLAHGRLQRLALSLTGQDGPKPIRLWQNPLALGSPQHAAQVLEERGRTRLYLVTQPLQRPVCLATAIDPEASDEDAVAQERRVLWQRQLGMVCQGEPLLIGSEVLVADQGGGLFRFDPRSFRAGVRGLWQVGGQAVATGLAHDPALPPLLLRGPGRTAYHIVGRAGGATLVVRRYEAPAANKKNPRPEVADQVVDLKGPKLAGNVALLGAALLVPLDNGDLVRYTLPLQEGAVPASGPTWRSRRAAPEARCFVVSLSANAFLTTDGSRGLTHWKWEKQVTGQPRPFAKPILPPGKPREEPPTVELSDRIATAPLVLSAADGKVSLQVLVADAGGAVTLLKGDTLVPGRTWQLGGTITAGPFLRGRRVGCVVGRRRLVWLDPDRDGKLWEFVASGGDIVGQPVEVDGLLVVCDEGGTFVGLDAATGKRQGEGYTLKAAVAPAATAVPFGPGRAFAPLTDGTVLLLSLDRLRAPWWWWPLYQRNG